MDVVAPVYSALNVTVPPNYARDVTSPVDIASLRSVRSHSLGGGLCQEDDACATGCWCACFIFGSTVEITSGFARFQKTTSGIMLCGPDMCGKSQRM